MTTNCSLGIWMIIKRILIIDDEANVREVVKTCLNKLGGWNVLVAASGYEGLTLAQSEQPDAILLDLMMPGMDGITFLERLRANPETQSIPVMLLTANAYMTGSQVASRLGITAAISKPFDPMGLVSQVSNAFGWNQDSQT